MNPRTTLLALLIPLALLTAGGSPAQEADDVLVDSGLCFRLKAAPGWRILSRLESQKVVPDGCGGAHHLRGFYAVVLVEHAPGLEAEAYARIVREAMPLVEKRLLSLERVKVDGRPAVRFEVVGKVQGLEIHYRNTVLIHQDHAYQIMVWGARVRTCRTPGWADPIAAGFSILPGRVRASSKPSDVPDSAGVGWRVTGGRFESAVYRLAVRPTGRWRVAVGAELTSMDLEAEVGLVHTRPDVYAIVTPEWFRGIDPKTYREFVFEDTEGLVRVPGTIRARLDGRPIEFRRYRGLGSPEIALFKGCLLVGDLGLQVVVWSVESLGDKAKALIPDALGAIEILDEKRANTLAAALEKQPDPQNRVGPGFSLRGGVYRDFAQGFVWRKPRGFWRVWAGEAARADNEDATLVFNELLLGIGGTVISEERGTFSPESYHETILEGFIGGSEVAEVEKLRTAVVPGARLRISDIHEPARNGPWTYRIVTAVSRDRALQMLIHGPRKNMESAREAIEAATTGLGFPAGLEAETVRGASVRNQRFGFALSPPGAGWKYRNTTPRAVDACSTVGSWKRGKCQAILVAICPLLPGQDKEWFEGFMRNSLVRRIRRELGSTPRREATELGGLEGELLTITTPEGDVRLWIVRRDRTFYALTLVDADETTRATFPSGFRLLP